MKDFILFLRQTFGFQPGEDPAHTARTPDIAPNRWAAFTDDELAAISTPFDGTETQNALWDEIRAEIARREAADGP